MPAKTIQIEKHKLILISVVAVLFITVIILLITIFKPKGKTPDDYEARISLLDSVNKYKDLIIDEKNGQLLKKDTAIAMQFDIIKYKDSLLQINLSNEKKHIIYYNQVPAAVRNLDKEQLRREVTGFKSP